MFNTIILAKAEVLAAKVEEEIRFAAAKEILQRQPKGQISQEALEACTEADAAMDRLRTKLTLLQAAVRRFEQLQSN